MKLKKPALSGIVLLVLATWGNASAQVVGGNPQRSIEETQSSLPNKRKEPMALGDAPETSASEPMERLDSVEVQGDELRSDILSYWKNSIGSPVSAQQIDDFKAWVYFTANSRGYMAYADTASQSNTLQVVLVLPHINSVRVIARDKELAQRYLRMVSTLFESKFKPGNRISVIELEQQIEALRFTQPLELEVTIRAAGPELLDLLVSVAEASNRPGSLEGGLYQLNSYGLKQFGEPQALAQLTLNGHVVSSKLTLTGQKTQGIGFLRAEYDMPVEEIDSRLHISTGYTNSKGVLSGQSNSKAESTELLLGIERQIGYRGEVIYKGNIDFSDRQAKSNLVSTGDELNRIHDQQVRLHFSADSERFASEPLRMDLTLTAGTYPTLSNYTNVTRDDYSKLEIGARKQLNVSRDNGWLGVLKFRGQWSSAHLDGGNQLTLGGANGVRAYTTVDGQGDDGVLFSAELNYKLSSNQIVGVFYDGGVVRASAVPITGIYTDPYALQALGIQTTGNANHWYYNVFLAKGFGGNKGALSTDTESTPDNWRFAGALTYVF